MKTKTIYPPTYFYSSISVMVVLHLFFPLAQVFNYYWSLIGLIPIILGLYLNLTADKLFKKFNTTVKPGEEPEQLMTDGIFRISRNPMYLGMTLALLGFDIILGSLSPFLVIPVFIFVIESKFIKIEEQMLTEKFGIHWNEYKSTTRKWI